MKDEMSKLYSRLRTLNSDAFGYLLSGTNHMQMRVKQDDQKRIQANLDILVGEMNVVYLFSLFESALENGSNSVGFDKDLCEKYMTHDGDVYPGDFEKFLAFRHVRHTIAHSLDGTRAQRHVTEFDNVMSREEMKDRIRNVDILVDDKIKVKKAISSELRDFLEIVVSRILVYSATNDI